MKRVPWLLVLACMVSGVAVAARVYQWKDEAGRVHFTDDATKVPSAYRHKSARDIRPVEPMAGAAPSKDERTLDGNALYQKKCAACHVLGFKDKGEKEALGWAIINPDTNYPRSADELFRKLRYVVDGGIDMPEVDASDDELKAIARYLIEASKP